MSKQIMVSVPLNKMVKVIENHGGYLGTQCVVCEECGWKDKWEHKKNCPVGVALRKAAQLKKKSVRKKSPTLVL